MKLKRAAASATPKSAGDADAIDLTRPDSRRFATTRAVMLREAARRRIQVIPHGRGWRVVGHGVDVLISDPGFLRAEDLEPVFGRTLVRS